MKKLDLDAVERMLNDNISGSADRALAQELLEAARRGQEYEEHVQRIVENALKPSESRARRWCVRCCEYNCQCW